MTATRNAILFQISPDDLFDALREHIADEVARQVAVQLSQMQRSETLPEILTVEQARRLTGLRDARTIRKRYPDAATVCGGRPGFLKSKLC